MRILVGKAGVGRSMFVATLVGDNTTMYNSGLHHRPGCAVREAINWLYKTYGDIQLIELDIAEIE